MPLRPLVPFIRFPGLTGGVRSLTYTCSQGTTPGTAFLIVNPQPIAPLLFGDLAFGAGSNGVLLTDCRVTNIIVERSGGGISWVISIEDRRWRWRQGVVNGKYNELDHHGKLVPWTIRSPTELALLCLAELGETNFFIDLPAGLTQNDGASYAARLRVGQNFPDFGTNPPTDWTVTSAAAALTQICSRYGRRIFLDPVTGRVVIARSGGDIPIPLASINTEGIGFSAKPKPRAVVAVGAQNRYQMRLTLLPVAREWDGTYVDLDSVSYAPKNPVGTVQIVNLLSANVASIGLTATIDGMEISAVGRPALLAALQADAWVTARYDVTIGFGTGTPIILTGKVIGQNPAVLFEADSHPPGSYAVAKVIQVGKGVVGWSTSPLNFFSNVTATARLTTDQAIQLARESVYRCYRVAEVDVSGGGPIQVPGYGFIDRRLQLVITPDKVEQIVPSELDPNGVLKHFQFNPEVPGPFYNGSSQDQPARVYGSYASGLIGDTIWKGQDINTESDALVRVPFSVDPYEQVITFSEPVYRFAGGGPDMIREPAQLTLECAVLVKNADTNAIERFVAFQDLGGPGQQHAEIFPDLVNEIVGNYTQQVKDYEPGSGGGLPVKLPFWNLTDFTRFLPQQTDARAAQYLDEMARQYQPFPAETVKFNGVLKVQLSGSVQQVTWEIGPAGIFTTLSANSEHDPAYPSYQARRLPENLPPIDQLNRQRDDANGMKRPGEDGTSGGRGQQ